MNRRGSGKAVSVHFGVFDSLVHGAAMRTVDKVKLSAESAVEKLRAFDTTLGNESPRSDRESAELAP